MNVRQLKDTIKLGYKINRPVCSLSSPGIGKSSAVLQCCEELAEEYGTPFGMIEIRAASSSPAELAAIKYVSNNCVNDAEQKWFPTDEKVAAGECPERGFIFCDEITGGLPAVQSTLQRMFLDRKLGGLTMAKGWQAIAAGNRAKDKSASGNLSRAFQNRCIMVTVLPDPDVFYDWGLDNGLDMRCLAFVRWQKECLNDGLEVHRHRHENQAFCSPRSMEITSDILKGEDQVPESLLQEIILGTLGDGVGSTFNGFCRIMNDLPDLNKILEDPDNYPVPTKTDVAWATIGALTQRANEKNVRTALKYFLRFPTELSVVAMKDMGKHAKKNFKNPDALYQTPEFIAWASDSIKFSMN